MLTKSYYIVIIGPRGHMIAGFPVAGPTVNDVADAAAGSLVADCPDPYEVLVRVFGDDETTDLRYRITPDGAHLAA